MNKLCLIIICCFISTLSFAENEAYYDNHDNGWHWYDDPEEEQSTETISEKTPSAPPSNVSATEEMQALQKSFRGSKK
ncbi:MAG: hypothetical protein LRY43_00960 [Gammaproteobacteria bacterium]|nr:hypothetical protein [Gammaproteobacteria bacterium]